MRTTVIIILIILFVASSSWGIINDEFKLIGAHAIPTAYTLNKGEVLIGIGPLGYGITDRFQVSTNMLLDIFQVFNADAKMNFIDGRIGLGGGIGFQHFSLFDVDYNALIFGGFLSVPLSERFKLHTGASFAYIQDFDIDEVEFKGGYEGGTTIPVDFEYNLSEHAALLGGAAYDLTFEYYRVGISYLHSWDRFNLQLGGNIAGGSVIDVDTDKEDSWTYFLPTIAIFWRL
ncbi:hypothetical protein JXI42_13650 [bacterium]|nr:hypothetical protein [bacterium]